MSCQENWFLLRKQYVDGRRAESSSQLATDSLFLQTYREHMAFLESNAEQWTQLLLEPNDTSHSIKNEEVLRTTSQPIKNKEVDKPPIAIDSNSRSNFVDSTNMLQKLIHKDAEPLSSSEVDSVEPLNSNGTMSTTKAGSKRRQRSDLWETVVLKKPRDSCEDTAFGEWVTARLLKLNASENQQAKKEIIDILLWVGLKGRYGVM